MANGATTDISAVVGGNIRAARQAAGMTQQQLAIALGRGDSMTVSRWERGEHRPSDAGLIRLSEVLGQTVAWFYTEHKAAA